MAGSGALSGVSDEDLAEMLAESKEELLNLRFQNVTGQLDNHARIKETKKQVARVLTELRAREIEAAEAAAQEEAS